MEHKNYYVACGGSPIKLPRTEFLIFSRLTRTPNRIVASDELWSSVWGGNKPLNSESLHVYIYRLRAKLADFGLQIETMVNVGYRLITSKSARKTHSRDDLLTENSDSRSVRCNTSCLDLSFAKTLEQSVQQHWRS